MIRVLVWGYTEYNTLTLAYIFQIFSTANIFRDQAEDKYYTSTLFYTNHRHLISKQEQRQKGTKEQ